MNPQYDVYGRCVTCGSRPSEDCCEMCHRAQRALETQRKETLRQHGLNRARDNFGHVQPHHLREEPADG